jgi:hypothetical protein
MFKGGLNLSASASLRMTSSVTQCTVSATEKSARFTLDGSESLERELAELCSEVRSALLKLLPAARIQAVLLGGGYGRGEGGVLREPAGDRLYNDVEFFVLLKGWPRLNEYRYGTTLHHCSQRLSQAHGVDVEFKVISL